MVAQHHLEATKEKNFEGRREADIYTIKNEKSSSTAPKTDTVKVEVSEPFAPK